MAFKDRMASATGKVLSLKAERQAAQADSDRAAVKLARETKGQRLGSVGTGRMAKNPEEQANRDILTARTRTAQIKREVEKRKQKYGQ